MNMQAKSFGADAPVTERSHREDERRRLSSHDLLRGDKRLIIEHEGTEYTLHLTRQNKLLLTK